MSLQDIKNQIIKNINTILAFDLSKLYPDQPSVVGWNDLTSDELKKFVSKIASILEKIKKYPVVLDDLPFNFLNEINNQSRFFVDQFRAIENLDQSQITSHHHTPLNTLQTLGNTFRASGLYTELKLKPDFAEIVGKLNSANKELKDFNAEQFQKAIGLVNELIEKKYLLKIRQ